MSEFWADVSISLVPTESGGRTVPLDLCNDRPGQYRPHLRVIGWSFEMLGVAFMDGPDDPILPGEHTRDNKIALRAECFVRRVDRGCSL